MFQRQVETEDSNTDNEFRSELTFIWAYGQSEDDGFYKDDELKYHGKPGQLDKVTRGSKGRRDSIT